MKHLFIINPAAEHVKGKVNQIIATIEDFFRNHTNIEYDIHVTRCSRDAVGFIQLYMSVAKELVRIYAVGGTGTLFEVVNGAIGLPNVQIANYPLGFNNAFIRYFGEHRMHMFLSLSNLVMSNTIPIDVIRCGGNYGIAYSTVGIESLIKETGREISQKTPFSPGACYLGAGIYSILTSHEAHKGYKITLDGEQLDGNYFSILIANGPCYGARMKSAVDAHPNDGVFDVYVGKSVSRWKMLSYASIYVSGRYQEIPEMINHYTGKKMQITSDDVMCMTLDGEMFYDVAVDYEIITRAIDFVCPSGIDISKLPKIYGM